MTSLVLGLGNSLVGADGFGAAVLERLRHEASLSAGVDLIDAGTDLLAHLDRFDGRDHVVLVDAVLHDGPPSVDTFDEPVFTAWDDRSVGAHAISPVAAVKVFRRLRRADGPPRITLIAYCVGEREFHAPPSPDIVRAGAAAVLATLGGLGASGST